MKIIIPRPLWLLLSILAVFDFHFCVCLAQGTLSPPGPPGPTMKTLSQVEPRTDVLTLSGDDGNQYIITNSGSYYLTTNIVGVSAKSGIEILADNVTLDLNGFSLLGLSSSGDGISTRTAVTNLTVRNGTVSGWGASGIYTTSGSIGVLLEHLAVFGNGQVGINNNGSGEARDCMAVSNGIWGIIFGGSGSVLNCTVNDNSDFGIGLTASVPLSGSVRNCHVENNPVAGIYISGDDNEASGNLCVGNNASVSTGWGGIVVDGSNNRIENNHVAASGYGGILVGTSFGTNNIIIRNSVSGNGTNNYIFATNQVAGPLISTRGTITNSNPWANFSF